MVGQRTRMPKSLRAKLVAKLLPWEEAPDNRHAAISTLLSTALGAENMAQLVQVAVGDPVGV
jgi:peroxin-1